jgi:hypothetical protein
MLLKPSGDVLAKTDVKSAFTILKDVNLVSCRHAAEKLVAGARFELAIPQPRDYEPARGKPVNR